MTLLSPVMKAGMTFTKTGGQNSLKKWFSMNFLSWEMPYLETLNWGMVVSKIIWEFDTLLSQLLIKLRVKTVCAFICYIFSFYPIVNEGKILVSLRNYFVTFFTNKVIFSCRLSTFFITIVYANDKRCIIYPISLKRHLILIYFMLANYKMNPWDYFLWLSLWLLS